MGGVYLNSLDISEFKVLGPTITFFSRKKLSSAEKVLFEQFLLSLEHALESLNSDEENEEDEEDSEE